MKIIPFRRVYEDMGKSRQSRYLNRYLTALGAKTVVVEDNYIQSLLENSYLGFVVVKPITDPEQQNEPFIGRTVLKTYSKDDGDEHRHFLINSYSASLFGFPLTIKSLPYQTQDSMVSKCATTAIWVSLYALNALFGTQTHSPFEITQTSVSFPGLNHAVVVSGYRYDNNSNLKELYVHDDQIGTYSKVSLKKPDTKPICF